MSKLSKPVGLITGGAQGIGKATARQLAKVGYRIVINDLPGNSAMAESVANAIGDAIVMVADVGNRAEMEQLFGKIIDHFGRLDVAIANAAFQSKKRITELDWPTAQRIFEVTQFGVFHVAQLAAKQMIKQNQEGVTQQARIILIGSIHADMAIPYHGPYAMAKAAGNQLCRTLAAELSQYRINVNAINPGWIDTEGERQYISEQELLDAADRLPWKRLGSPNEIAKLISFLVSPAADYITGSILTMDGGLRLNQAQITRGLSD